MSSARVRPLPHVVAALVLAALPGALSAQARLQCESREYGYQFCPTGAVLEDARLVEQRSRAACIEGQSWGWDRRGIWVDRGCEGIFDIRTARPAPPAAVAARVVSCESRDYQYAFCAVADEIASAQLLEQRSQAPCVEGRTWGWRANGIWVAGGCEADFRYRSASAPAPAAPPPARRLLVCESRDGRYTFCPTGQVRLVELVRQRSQAACLDGQTWGYQNDGIWVDHGCGAEFSVQLR